MGIGQSTLFGRENKFLSKPAPFVQPAPAMLNPPPLPTFNQSAVPAGLDKVYTYDLSVARTDELLDIAGNAVWYLKGTNPSDEVLIRFSDATNDALPTSPGFYRGNHAFSRLYISNEVQAGAVAYLVVSNNVETVEVEE